jgi:hypothetical protein
MVVSEHILKNYDRFLHQCAARIAYETLIQLLVAQYLRTHPKQARAEVPSHNSKTVTVYGGSFGGF